VGGCHQEEKAYQEGQRPVNYSESAQTIPKTCSGFFPDDVNNSGMFSRKSRTVSAFLSGNIYCVKENKNPRGMTSRFVLLFFIFLLFLFVFLILLGEDFLRR